jgi:hypothetical protein
MSMTILRRREPEPFEIPPLPVRLSGQDLRGGLARFCAPVTIRLGPGERVIAGRVYYSAAWLDPAEGGSMNDLIRFTTEGREVVREAGEEARSSRARAGGRRAHDFRGMARRTRHPRAGRDSELRLLVKEDSTERMAEAHS